MRATADPSVIYHEEKWYLYCTSGVVYDSDDFVNWTLHPDSSWMPISAPMALTVALFREKFYASANSVPLHVSDSPTGPFYERRIGMDSCGIDENGKLYALTGCEMPQYVPGVPEHPEKGNAVELDFDAGVMPGAYRYYIEAQAPKSSEWVVLVDASENTVDLTVDCHTFPEFLPSRIYLRIVGAPDGLIPGVIDFSVFGESAAKRDFYRK